MAFPKFKWTEQTPGMENKWSKMWNKVVIQRPKGTIDAAGGTPMRGSENWEDVVVGHDGNGVSAEILEPTPEDALLALEQHVRFTYKIKVRYDGRITTGMRAVFYFEGNYHKARIHTITDPQFMQTWMILDCVEDTMQGSQYL